MNHGATYSDEIITKSIMIYAQKEGNDPSVKCSEYVASHDSGKVCEGCKKYCALLKNAYNDMSSISTKMATPYISSVTDHWYRNVYFESDDIGDDNIVANDEEYEQTTGERWTLYEMYKAYARDSEGNIIQVEDEYGVKKNVENEEYLLLLYVDKDGDGNYTGDEVADFYQTGGEYPMLISMGYKYNKDYYKKSKDGVSYIKASVEEEEDKKEKTDETEEDKQIEYFALCKWENDADKVYTESDVKTYDISKFRVGKKAVLTSLDEVWEDGKDAYKDSTMDTGWTEAVDEDAWRLSDDEVQALKSIGATAEYNITDIAIKEQDEDGIRGETNAKIKEIFLDEYYLYDGSTERAALIQKAKKEISEKIDDDDDPNDPDNWTDILTQYAVYIDSDTGVIYHEAGEYKEETASRKISLTGLFEDTNKDDEKYYTDERPETKTIYYNKNDGMYYDDSGYTTKSTISKSVAGKNDITGSVNILRNSLSSFTILKNMGTLAAEYIYHDFKELIVELDYFDKEDLLEAENDVMMFPVPDISSYNWPLASDRDAANYGTLIKSEADENISKIETMNEVLNKEDETMTEERWQEIQDTAEYSVPTNATSSSEGTETYDNLFLQAAEDIHKYMEDNKYTYNVADCTFEESKTRKYACCATYVTWVYQAVGLTSINSNGATRIYNQAAKDTTNFETIDYDHNLDSKEQLQAGDVVVAKDHHIQIFAGFADDGTETWYNAGATSAIQANSPQKYNVDSSETWCHWTYIIRIKPGVTLTYNGATSTTAGSSSSPYTGYKGGETVVAPVTGEVIKYGKVKRKNIEIQKAIDAIKDGTDTLNKDKLEEYEAALEQEVGFIKIKVANNEVNELAKTLEDAKGYEYFFEEYSIDVGISGYVLYIEGFDVSDILGDVTIESGKTSNSSKSNISALYDYIVGDGEELCNYKTNYVVPSLASEELKEELVDQELAKVDALYAFKNGEKVYIKEGAVIGKTYGNGSTDDSKSESEGETENVESYNLGEEIAGITVQRKMEVSDFSDTGVLISTEETFNIGNYVRMIFRDTNSEVVENIEEYIEIDKNTNSSSPSDMELFYWLPFECGGTDIDGCGPESYSSCSTGEVAIGIIQWTDLTSTNMNNISNQFIKGCLEKNVNLCSSLKNYRNWSANDFWNDYEGSQTFKAAVSAICDKNRDEFLNTQMEIAKEQYLSPLLESYPWLENRPSCVQGEIMHLKVWGASTDWVSTYENSSDEEIIKKVRNVIANTGSTAGAATGDENSGRAYNEPQIALDILSGKMTKDKVELWVKQKDSSALCFDFK